MASRESRPSLSPATVAALRCPACRGSLSPAAAEIACTACGRSYPRTAHGVPVLIDEEQSVFATDTFTRGDATFFRPHGRLFRLLRSLTPSNVVKANTRKNLRTLREHLVARGPSRVLVIGGSIRGPAMDELVDDRIELVETDAAIGPHTALICDAHSIPFESGTFDAVLAQCVLEHVADPERCVAEFHRVLRPRGLVYAETAFMQQVHGGRYDFNRYSELGHRRLFRRFEVIASGATDGPGTALAWSYEQLLLTLVPARSARNVVKAFARLTSFFVKYLDYAVLDRPAALDGASAVFFFGQRSERTISDRELVASYRGADR